MHSSTLLLWIATGAVALPAPVTDSSASLSDPSYGPVPGESSTYINDTAKSVPFPANFTAPIPTTEHGAQGPDDLLFQNLLSAEWAIFSFYQQAVEAFNESSFTDLGLPNTTYYRIAEIRDNEAGHLRIFQDRISSTSLKPGSCKYEYGFTSAEEWLELQVLIEVSSMAFLTGLVQQAELIATRGALVAIGEVETRHNTWALIDVWNADPFAGPSDTVFPYANQILDLTNRFIVPGSCPAENPVYPLPRQNLPTLSTDTNTTTPGLDITFSFPDADNQPDWYGQQAEREYYAVFFHGVNNITKPFNTQTNVSTIPQEFDSVGIIIAVIADVVGAPTLDSVVAGPLIIMGQL